ncbi:thiamine biosynthesis protein ThiS [archaeon]|jgi:sulfur carrier protein|nr:thiamine biosynthesis protein ThiS [archaeon]MBT3450988.1 thiamine biosynthesis protein ThiS [archaeon]MBT6868592.1 thiamine biosynthesis protein ThiS [archaeon]MBT7193124.1 thiamine biosynthesis protein ThiS [archaeon]MBT7381104.1 thiamine biosynthesis protein ThiS [archaeon]
MKITVFNEKKQEELEIEFQEKTVKELLKQIKVNSETVLIIKNDEVVTLDEILQDNDKLKLLSVISGG